MNEQELLEVAKRRANEKLGFYTHFATFSVVMAALYGINMLVSPQFEWWKFAFLGWGIGLLIHFFAVFIVSGQNLKERLIQQELRSLQEFNEQQQLLKQPQISNQPQFYNPRQFNNQPPQVYNPQEIQNQPRR